MNNPILVAYASKYGATEEVAQTIGEVLTEEGLDVDVQPVGTVETLQNYEAVVIGAPLYSANWLEEATVFVKTHQKALGDLPVACFVLAIRLRLDDEEIRNAVLRAIDTERVIMQPVSVGLFAGALDYDKLSAITRLQIETKDLPEGDFRDWEAIKGWAAALPGQLANG